MSTNLELSLKSAVEVPALPAVDIRYGQIGLLQVRVRTTDPGLIVDELTGRIASAPHFFRRTAVCLDLGALETMPEVSAVRSVMDAIRRAGMMSVGLAGSGSEIESVAGALGLPVLSSFRAQGGSVPTVQAAEPVPTVSTVAPEPEPVAQGGLAAMIHAQTVRSGQKVYARNRDLVVTAVVSAGAEVITDGCLHVYGALRGRAMAGAHGQVGARVFCQEFYAELVSIAGVFRVFETIPAELAGKPVQAWLTGDDLHFARVGA